MKGAFLFITMLAILIKSALAVGPFDGVYKHPTLPNRYASVHQTGTRMIIATFDTSTTLSSGFNVISPIGTFKPNRMDYWELTNGPMTGVNTIRINGETVFGACIQSFDLTFDQNNMTVQQISIDQTPIGLAQNMACSSLLQSGSTPLIYPKIF